MAYRQLSYQHASWKGSRNSYQRYERLDEQLRWVSGDPSHGGCRAVEIDITDHSDNSGGRSASYLQVTHDKGGNGPPLANYLTTLKAVHAADPTHDPIFVTLDIKSEEGRYDTFPTLLEAYLVQWFTPSLLFTPADIVHDRTRSLFDNFAR